MVIEISVALTALAFVFLVIYLIIVTKALRLTLEEVNKTLVETRKQLGEIGLQAQKTFENTNQISSDFKAKVEAFNPFFSAVNQAGQILEDRATAFKKDYLSSTQEEDFFSSLDPSQYSEKKRGSPSSQFMTVAAILELAGIGINLWQKIKKRR